MCEPTYPIFRCGSILRADKPAIAQTTVDLGRKLEASSEDFTSAFLRFLSKTMKLGKVERTPVTSGSSTRVRVHPVIIVDFPPVRFKFDGLKVDARVCMTTWTGERKAKIWTRYSVVDLQSDKKTVARFFAHARKAAPLVQTFVEEYYSALIQSAFSIKVEKIFEIYIRMVSTPNRRILRAVDDDQSPSRPMSKAKLLATAVRVLQSEFGLDLGIPQEQTQRLVKSFQYPLNSMLAISEKAGVEPTTESLERLLTLSIPEYDDNVQGLYIVDLNKTEAEVYGIAYEEFAPKAFTNAASQIASAELSYQLGGVY
jgi:hypothetical protein